MLAVKFVNKIAIGLREYELLPTDAIEYKLHYNKAGEYNARTEHIDTIDDQPKLYIGSMMDSLLNSHSKDIYTPCLRCLIVMRRDPLTIQLLCQTCIADISTAGGTGTIDDDRLTELWVNKSIIRLSP